MTGPSGSGESRYTRKYLEQWKKKNKAKNVYMFNSLPEDITGRDQAAEDKTRLVNL